MSEPATPQRPPRRRWWRDPACLQKHLGKFVLAAGAVLIFFGLKDVHFARIAPDDDSTPAIAPGSRVIVRTLAEDDGELVRGGLYLVDLTGAAGAIESLRMARLVGLPGDAIERGPRELRIGGRPVTMPPELAALLPERVPDDCCLVLTDNPAARHLDSRALGPLPLERLKLRVVTSLGSFTR